MQNRHGQEWRLVIPLARAEKVQGRPENRLEWRECILAARAFRPGFRPELQCCAEKRANECQVSGKFDIRSALLRRRCDNMRDLYDLCAAHISRVRLSGGLYMWKEELNCAS